VEGSSSFFLSPFTATLASSIVINEVSYNNDASAEVRKRRKRSKQAAVIPLHSVKAAQVQPQVVFLKNKGWWFISAAGETAGGRAGLRRGAAATRSCCKFHQLALANRRRLGARARPASARPAHQGKKDAADRKKES
jgi:hypothetical protein